MTFFTSQKHDLSSIGDKTPIRPFKAYQLKNPTEFKSSIQTLMFAHWTAMTLNYLTPYAYYRHGKILLKYITKNINNYLAFHSLS